MADYFELKKGYKKNDSLRKSFNELAEKTFDLEFEDWYQNGYWGEQYIPYSIVKDEKVVANVSVNIMEFIWEGEQKHLLQLGTVMTEEAYRKKGLIRRLMQEIEKDYQGMKEGIYLFANDSVLEFYPKFGFRKAQEYQYSKAVEIQQEKSAIQIQMKDKNTRMTFERVIANSTPNSLLEMINNINLVMFYLTKFMNQNIYYVREQNAYIIAEIEEQNLILHHIFSEDIVNLDSVIWAFGRTIKNVTLGFVPIEKEMYVISPKKEDTLFVKGRAFEEFEQKMVMFPTLSHA